MQILLTIIKRKVKFLANNDAHHIFHYINRHSLAFSLRLLVTLSVVIIQKIYFICCTLHYLKLELSNDYFF